MSTTQTPSTDTDDSVSPEQAFDQLIWHNSRICNGCFEHVKTIDEAQLSHGRAELLDVQDHHRTPQATLEQDEQIATDVDGGSGPVRRSDAGDSVNRPGQQRSAVPRTTCQTCARIGCWADDDTLSKVQALRLTTPLANRLKDTDIEFDHYTLREFIRIAKGLDKYAGYDTEIFRCAVKMAVQRGQ